MQLQHNSRICANESGQFSKVLNNDIFVLLFLKERRQTSLNIIELLYNLSIIN